MTDGSLFRKLLPQPKSESISFPPASGLSPERRSSARVPHAFRKYDPSASEWSRSYPEAEDCSLPILYKIPLHERMSGPRPLLACCSLLDGAQAGTVLLGVKGKAPDMFTDFLQALFHTCLSSLAENSAIEFLIMIKHSGFTVVSTLDHGGLKFVHPDEKLRALLQWCHFGPRWSKVHYWDSFELIG